MSGGSDYWGFEEYPPAAAGPPGPPGPAGSAPTGTLAALTAANRFVVRLAAGLTVHDGTEASAAAMLGGGMCATGGSAAATVTYYPDGGLAPVGGATGWTQNVPLYPNAAGGMVPRGDATLTGIYSRECGIYDGTVFAVAVGQLEDFT